MAIKASTNADQGATHQCRMSDQVTEVQKAQSTYPESRPISTQSYNKSTWISCDCKVDQYLCTSKGVITVL